MIETFRSRLAVRGFFSRLLATMQLGKAKRRHSRRMSRMIERLEDRTLLSYSSTLAGTVVTFTGDAGADTLTFTDDGAGLLQHNRFGAGDAGFNSAIDIDSGTAGDQTVMIAAITVLTVNAGDGDDVIQLNGLAFGATPTLAIDGQVGADTFSVITGAVTGAGATSLTAETINQTAALTLAGAQLTLNTGAGGSATLANAGNAFQNVTFTSGGAVALASTSDMALTGSSSAASVDLDGIGGAFFSDGGAGALTVTGLADLNFGQISLDNTASHLFGTLTFNSAGSVTINENSAMDIVGANTGASANLDSTGAISDAGAASVAITGLMDVNGTSISLGGGTFNAGTLRFNSAGAVVVSEDSGMDITGTNTGASADLDSTGAISDAGATSVAITGLMDANGTSISLGGGTFNAGTLRFNSAGAVVVSEDSGMDITGTNTGASADLDSTGAISDAGATSVAITGLTDVNGTSISLGGGTFNTGTLRFNSAGAVVVSEDSGMDITGTNTGASADLDSTGAISDAGATSVAITGLTDVNGTSISLGGGTFNTGTLRFNSAGAVVVSEDSGMDITGTNTGASADLDSTGAISDAGATSVAITGLTDVNGTSISLGGGTFNTGTLRFNSAGAVVVSEDSNMDITGTNTGASADLDSTGAISDAGATSVAITGLMDVNGTSINLGGGTFDAGTLTFNSAGAVTIVEDSGMNITGTNTGASANLDSAAGITDATATSVTITGLMDVAGTSISLGGGTFNAGTVNFNSAGAVVISEDSAMDIVGANTGASADLDSTGAISDAGAASVAITGLMDANGTSISLGGGTFNAGTVNFNSAGAVVISEDSAMDIVGANTGASADLDSTGAISDAGAASVAITGLMDANGTSISLGGGTFNAGTLRFNSAGAVVVSEDSGMDITGTNTGASADLDSTGAITDATATSVAITGLMDANGTSISLGGGTFNAGTLRFNSVGAVVVSEDSGMDIVGANTGASADLDSTGAISDAGAASVTITGLMDANGTSITLGSGGTFDAGTLTFNSAGAVVVSEDSGMNITGTNTGASADLDSTGAITDATATSVTITGLMDVNGTTISLGGGTFNAGTLRFNSAGAVVVSEDSNMDITGTNTGASADLDSTGAISDAGATSVAITGLMDANGTSISLGGGTFNAGTLTFNSAGAVVVSEDSGMDITGTNTGASADLDSTGAITDATATSVTITGLMDVNGTTISLGGGTFNAGTLRFNSAGAVVISEDSGMDITGTNTGASADLDSTGAISDSGATSVAITGLTDVNGTSISLGGGTFNTGTLRFNSAGAVVISEDSNMDIVGVNTGASADLDSTGAISDAGATSVTITGLMDANGTSVSLGGGTFNTGTLRFNSAGAVVIVEDSSTTVFGTNTAGSLDLTSAGAIIDAAGTSLTVTNDARLDASGLIGQTGPIVATGLEIIADGAVTLNTAANNVVTLAFNLTGAGAADAFQYTDSTALAIGTVGATDGGTTNGGAITVVSTTGGLTVNDTAAAQDVDSNGGTIVMTANGNDQVLTISGSAGVQSNGGTITYTADDMTISATSTTNSTNARIILQPETTTDLVDGMDLGSNPGTANVLELSDAEIETLTTSNVVQLGNSTMTGAIVVTVVGFGDDDADGFSTMHLFTGNTSTTLGSEAVRDTSGITQANLAITSVGSVNLNGLNDVDNLAAAITGSTAAFFFRDNDDLDIDTVDGVVGISTNNGTVSLQTGGALTQNGAAGAITTGTAGLELLGTGPVTLNGPGNNVTTLSANITGGTNAVQYTDDNTLAIGTAGTTNGITTTNGALTINVTAGNLTIQNTTGNDIATGTGAIVLNVNADEASLIMNASAGVLNNAAITYSADKMNLNATSSTNATTGRIILQPEFTTEFDDGINLGSATDAAADTLELSDVEIETFVTAGVVQIGNGTITGSIVVSVLAFGDDDSDGFATMTLITGSTSTTAGSEAVRDTSGITQANLRIQSVGTVNLDGNNDVDKLSARVTGASSTFRFDDDDDLNVTTVDGVAGVQTTNGAGVNNIAINAAETSEGTLLISQSVIASATGNVLLRTITNTTGTGDINLNATVEALGTEMVVLRSADDIIDSLNDQANGTVRAFEGLFVAVNEVGTATSGPSISTALGQIAGQVTSGTDGTAGFFVEESNGGTTLAVDTVVDFSTATETPGGGLGSFDGITTANGSPVEIRTRFGSLTVNQQVTVNGTMNNGSILLVAGGAASDIVTQNLGGDVTTNDTTILPSAGITMIAGNDITIGDTVTSSGGTIHFITGQANSDTFSTTATGNVNSTNGLIVINANAVANAAGAVINSGTANTVVRPNAAAHSIDIGAVADSAGVLALSQTDILAFATTGAGVLIIGSSTDADSTPATGTAAVTTFPTSADPVTGADNTNGGEFDTTGINHSTGDVNFQVDVDNVTLISNGAIGATIADSDLILSGSTTGVFTLDSQTGITGLSGSADAITGTADNTKLSVDAAIVAARTQTSGNIRLHFPSTQGLAISDATLDPTYVPAPGNTNITTVVGRSTGMATNFNGVTTIANGTIDLEVDDANNPAANRVLVTRQPITAGGSGNIIVTALNDGIVQMITGTAQTVSQTDPLPISNNGNWSTTSGNITTLHGEDITPDTVGSVTENVFKMAGLFTTRALGGDVSINFHSNVEDNNTGTVNITGDALTITDLTDDNGAAAGGNKLANFGVGGDNIELDVNSITVTGGVVGSFVITSVAGDLHVAQTTTQNGPFSVTLLGLNATLFLDGNITVAENFSFLVQAPTVRVGARVDVSASGTNSVSAMFRGDEIDFTSGNPDQISFTNVGGAATGFLHLEPFSVGTDIEVGADTLLAQLNLDVADLDSIGARVGGATNWSRVFVGREDGTGTMTFSAPTTWTDPTVFQMKGAGGRFLVNGNVTSTQPAGGTFPGLEWRGSGLTYNLNANVTTAGTSVVINDSVEVQGNFTIDSTNAGGSPDGAAVVLNGQVFSEANETNNLTIVSGTGASAAGGFTVTGSIGLTQPLGNLTVDARNVFFNGPIQLAGNLDVDTFNTGSVLFNSNSTFVGSVTITNTGILTIQNGMALGAAGGFTQDGAGGVSVGGNLSTTNTLISFAGPITLTGATTLSAGTGAITLGAASTVNGTHALVLNSSGATTIGAAIGATTAIGSLTTNAGGTTTLSGGSITAQGNSMTFNDPVTLAAGTTLTDAGDVTFNSTLTGAFDLVLNVGGTTRFVGAVGAAAIGDGAGAAITINSTGATIFESTLATASGITQAGSAGTLTLRDNVTLGNGDTATALNGNVVLDGLTITVNHDENFTVGSDETDAITLSGGAVSIDSSANNARQTYNGQVNGSQDLTINAGTNSVTFNASLGQTSRIGDGTGAALTITGATTGANFGGAVSLASGLSSAADTTPVTFLENIDILAGDTATVINADALRMNGLTLTSAGNVTLTDDATDILTLDDAQVSINTSAAGTNIAVTGLVRSNDDNETTLVANAGNGNVTFTSAIGDAAANSLAALDVDGRNITVADIGAAAVAGVAGATDLNATAALTLTGTAYNGNSQTYTSGTGTSMTGAAPTITSSADAITFAGGTLTLGNGSDLTITSAGGNITAGTIRANSSEDVTINAASGNVSVAAIGSGNEVNTLAITGARITLNGNLTTDNAAGNTVTLTGPVHLGTAVTIDTSANAAGNVSLTSTLDGAHDFRISAGGTVSVAGAVGAGAGTPLSSLTLAGTSINLANIGTATTAGVTGATDVNGTTEINFNGTVYHTNVATYTSPAGNNLDMDAGAATSFLTSDDNLTFATGNIALANGSDLSINANGGTISIVAITGTSEEDVTIRSTGGTSNTVSVGAIGTAATDEIDDLSITAGTINLSGAINTGAAAGGGNVTLTGSVVLGAAIGITTDRGSDGNVTIDGTVNGVQTLTIDTGADGDLDLRGIVGGTTALTSVTVSESDNITMVGATTTGIQSYTADNGISIRGNYNTTNNTVTLTGSAVTLTGNAAIATGSGAGDITFAGGANVNGTNAGAESLSLAAGTGNVTLLNVGATVPFSSVEILSGAAVSMTSPATGGTFRVADLSSDTIAIAENNVIYVSFTNVTGAVGIAGAAAGSDSLTYYGTTGNDTVTATGAGDTLTANGQLLNITNFRDATGNTLTLNTGSGDDTISVTSAANLTYNVNGAEPSASDSLTVITGGSAANVTESSVAVTGGSTVNYTGIENLSVSGGGVVSLTGGAGQDTIAVNPTAATARINSGALIDFGASTAITADGAGNANDLVVVNGSASADTIAVVRAATTTVTVGAVVVSSVAASENIAISGGLGNDTVNVSGTAGAALSVDGGAGGTDTLNITTATAAVANTYTPGTTNDAGAFVNATDGTTTFVGIDSVSITGAAATDDITINGTQGDDTITLGSAPAATNRVWINERPVVTLATFDGVTLSGRFGRDAIAVQAEGLAGIATVTVTGGDTAEGDTLLVSGTTAGDTISYTPDAADLRTGSVVVGAITTNFSAIEGVSIDGLGGTDVTTLNGTANAETVVLTPAGNASGSLRVGASSPLSFTSLETITVDTLGAADTLVVNGTSNNDTVTLTATNATVNGQSFTLANEETVTLNSGDGDDTITVTPAAAVTFNVNGGNPTASDLLTVLTGGTASSVTESAVTVGANLAVNYTGIENLSISGGGTVTLLGGAGQDTIAVNPTAATARINSGALIDFGASTAITADGAGNANDLVVVNGSASADTIAVVRAATTTVTVGAVVVSSVAASENIAISGGLGNDTVNVSGTAGAALSVDGGAGGTDTLNITTATAAVANTYTPGTTNDAGAFVNATDGTTTFVGIDSVSITGAAATDDITINGTQGDDTITLGSAPAATNRVWINERPVVTLATFDGVTLSGRFGRDAIAVQAEGLAGIATVTVTGGDTAEGDTLLVSGTTAGDTISYTPDAADLRTGSVVVGAITTNFSAIEGVSIDGLGGTDVTTLNGTANAETVVLTPAGNASGSLRVGASSPLSFTSLETITINTGALADTLVVNGSGGNDTITITGTNATLNGQSFTLAGQEAVVANLGSGDDTATVTAAAGITVAVNGGDPSASDSLTFNGSGAAITIDLAAGTITESLLGAVSFTGVEHVTSDANLQDQTVNGSAANNAVTVTPTGADAAILTNAGQNTVFNLIDIGTFTVNGVGGDDSLTVNGTAAGEAISVTGTLVTVTGLQAVTYGTFDQLRVNGGAGADTFTVTPAATPMFIDGGDPTASTPGDILSITAGATAVTYSPGPEADDGSFVVGGNFVSFDRIEAANVVGAGAGSSLLVNGTNGDDDITLIGTGVQDFSVSVNAGPAVQYIDFPTVTLDAQSGDDDIDVDISVPGLGLTSFTVNGGEPFATGSDTLTVKGESNAADLANWTPASIHSGAFAASGQAIAVANIDRLVYTGHFENESLTVNGTAGSDTIVHTPGSTVDSGTVQVNSLLAISYERLGAGSVTIAAGAGAADALVVGGTNSNDTMTVAAATGTVTLVSQLGSHVPVLQTGVETLTLDAQNGDDTFNVTGDQPTTTINLLAGGPSASDVANLTGDATAMTVTLGIIPVTTTDATVAGGGLGTVNLSGVETTNVSNGAGAITVQGEDGNDTLVVTPSNLANTATVQANGLKPVVNATTTGTLAVAGGAGAADTLVYNGTSVGDTITVNGTTTTITHTGFKQITYDATSESLVVNSNGGNDGITLTGVTTGTTVDAGSGNDSVAGDATVTAALSIFGRDGNDSILGGNSNDTIYGGFGDDTIIGAVGNDQIYGEQGNDRFGDALTTGDGVANDPGADVFEGGDGIDQLIWEPGDGSDLFQGGSDGADILRFFGTAAVADVFTVQPNAAAPTHVNVILGAATVDAHGVEQINVTGQTGGDTFTINDLTATEVQHVLVDATAGDTDSVVVNGRDATDDITISTTAAGVVSVLGLDYDVQMINVTTADTLTVNANDGDDTVKAVDDVAAQINIVLNGGEGDDFLSADGVINGGDGNDFLEGGAGNNAMDGGAGDDTFVGNGGTDAIGGGAGSSVGDVILLPGTSGDDTFTLTLNATGHLLATINGLTTTYTNFVAGAISTSGIEHIVVDGKAGNDPLTVDSTLGAIAIPINFDGGENADSITLTGGTATSDVYSPGPNNGQGTSTIVIAGVTQTVRFSNLDPVLDVVAGPLVVNANNANNAINYSQGSVATNGLVAVDSLETIEFSNKTTLTLNALAGSDTININNSVTPTGLTGITVNGGDATASGSDTVIVNGTLIGEAITYTPTGADSGTVSVATLPTVTLATTERLFVNGLGGGDALQVNGTAGNDLFLHTPATVADAGEVSVNSLLAIGYLNLGATGGVTLDGDGALAVGLGSTNDTLIALGLAFSDTFTIAGTSSILLNNRIPLSTTQIENHILSGLDGDDRFNITPIIDATADDLTGTVDITVAGDGPGASDTLNFTVNEAAAGPFSIVVELDSNTAGADVIQTIRQVGLGTVTLSGIETANIDGDQNNAGAAANLWVAGTRVDDVITYTPTNTDAGTFTASGIATVFNFDDVPQATNTFTITGGGGATSLLGAGGFADKVIVQGTNGSDRIRVNSLTRVVAVDIQGFGFPPAVIASLRDVTLHNNVAALPAGMTAGIIEAVTVQGRDGGDTFHVVPGAPVGNGLYIDVDGGSPQASDALVITNLDGAGNPTVLAATDFVVVGQSRTPDAGNVLVYQSSVRRPNIAYTNTEVVTANVPFADPNVDDVNLLILGPDNYESNEFRTTATFLGSGSNINVDNLAIFPNSSEHVGVPQDTDYFRVVAHVTGTLDVQVYFKDLNGLVPDNGNLNLAVLDSDGTVIAGTGSAATSATFGVDEGAGDSDERIRIPAVQGETYYIRVFGGTVNVVNGYSMTVINDPAPVPYALELQDTPVGDDTLTNTPSNSDTGRSEFDNITRDNTPTLFFRLDDGAFLNDLPGNDATGTPPDQLTSIPFQGVTLLPGYRIAIFDEGNTPGQVAVAPQTPLGFATATAQQGVYTFTTPVLADGSHFLTARVQMIDPATPTDTGYGARSLPLEIIVDVVPPPVVFGLATSATDGLDAGSDSGVHAFPATFQDRATNVENPTFFGTAEADTIIRVYVDLNGNNTLETATDRLLSQVTAVPLDGTNQHPNGRWVATSNVNLNEPALGLGLDGVRRIFVIAEDVAGNVSAAQSLDIFIDTQGPQVVTPAGSANGVFITASPAYDLFDPKPSAGPTPRTDAITISLQDLPNRSLALFPNYLAALEAVLERPGHYVLRGDANGVIPISTINATLVNPVVNGAPATATIVLSFFSPLLDDRYTLTIDDSITDPANNSLDGESNSQEPQETPSNPSGDLTPGGDYIARFTIDSRSEIGSVGQGGISIDINGNLGFDPDNGDYVNRDLVFEYGINTDGYFAGKFNTPGAVTQDGFDRIGAYGQLNGSLRWLLDFTNDGRPDYSVVSGLQINGTPIAGNFNAAHIGDEIGLFDGVTWYFDTNNNNNIDAGDLSFSGNMRGLPIVGDFDGDTFDDLATHHAELDLFSFDLTSAADGTPGVRDGNADFSIHFNNPAVPLAQTLLLPGVLERPFTGDFNLDGTDDIGLMVPNRNGATPDGTAEYFLFLSDPAVAQVAGTAAKLNHQFAPKPLGVDLYAQFGTNVSIPLVGNFDPPVSSVTGTVGNNPQLTRLYRSYNFAANGHFFTPSYTEYVNAVASGQRDEASGLGGFAVYTQQAAGSVPLFRLLNIQNGAHYYTLNQVERDILVAINPPPTSGPDTRTSGYRDEGVQGYLFTAQQPGSTLVYRLYNNISGVHLFTESLATRNTILAQFPGIWVEHAALGFAFPIDANNSLTNGPVSAAARRASAMTAIPNSEASINLASLIALNPEERRTASLTSNLPGELQFSINVAANLTTSFAGSTSTSNDQFSRVGLGLSDSVTTVADSDLTSDLDDNSINGRRKEATEVANSLEAGMVDDLFADQAMLDEMFEEN